LQLIMFKRISWKLRIVFIVLFLVVCVVVGGNIFSKKTNGYVLGQVQKHTITEVVTESGLITAKGGAIVYSPTTGVISNVLVANGETVIENQKLFTVKSTATTQEKAAVIAAYEAAKSAVQQAENIRRSTQSTVDRVHDDMKNKEKTENFSEKETRTAAEVANDNAYDSLMAAKAQLKFAESSYRSVQNATVISPISGKITNLSVVVGSNVTVNNPLSPVSPVLIISGTGTTEIMISAGESDINKLTVGQKATIKLDAVVGKDYQGIVRRVDENGSLVQGVVKFNVYLEIIDPDQNIKSGMTADVDIITKEIGDVLSVPNTAVKPYQKGRAVRKLSEKGELIFIPVTIGVRGKDYTQIIDGLSAGQEIVVSVTNEKTSKTGPLGF
jgi:RND family efflux transporter MFP subunit